MSKLKRTRRTKLSAVPPTTQKAKLEKVRDHTAMSAEEYANALNSIAALETPGCVQMLTGGPPPLEPTNLRQMNVDGSKIPIFGESAGLSVKLSANAEGWSLLECCPWLYWLEIEIRPAKEVFMGVATHSSPPVWRTIGDQANPIFALAPVTATMPTWNSFYRWQARVARRRYGADINDGKCGQCGEINGGDLMVSYWEYSNQIPTIPSFKTPPQLIQRKNYPSQVSVQAGNGAKIIPSSLVAVDSDYTDVRANAASPKGVEWQALFVAVSTQLRELSLNVVLLANKKSSQELAIWDRIGAHWVPIWSGTVGIAKTQLSGLVPPGEAYRYVDNAGQLKVRIRASAPSKLRSYGDLLEINYKSS